MEEYLTTKEVSQLFKVHTLTIQRWRKSGKLSFKQISPKKFLYKKSDVLKLLGEEQTNCSNKINVCYCRVSTTKQKQDLEKQKQILRDYCNSNGIIIHQVYSDIASGMNENRTEFNKLIKEVIQGNINKVYITYKDRLTRFGFDYFKNLFEYYNTKIIVLNNNINQETMEQELTEDLISIIHHFSMKMYSNRRKQLKQIETQIKEVNVDENNISTNIQT